MFVFDISIAYCKQCRCNTLHAHVSRDAKDLVQCVDCSRDPILRDMAEDKIAIGRGYFTRAPNNLRG